MMLESLLRRQVSSTSGPTAIDDFEPDVATFLTPLRAMLTEAARRGQSRDADPQAIAYWFVVVDCSRAAVPPLSLPSRCCRVHALRGGGRSCPIWLPLLCRRSTPGGAKCSRCWARRSLYCRQSDDDITMTA